MNCSRCQVVLEETGFGGFDNILRVRLEGGYAEFVDDIVYSSRDKVNYPLYHVLCHQCGHELMTWLKVPEDQIRPWHPLDENEPLCKGWVHQKTLWD